MMTEHRVNIGNSQNLKKVEDESVNLIVTSPPYPMIEMWDEVFSSLNPAIADALNNENGFEAYDLMNKELNKVWAEVDRVLTPGGIACINIGDATRKIGDSFQLYSNHSRIISCFEQMGYQVLPDILWRKQSNKPNKFMGSGMLPPNAYVTLEHEYILIFRKGGNRQFKKQEEKEHRRGSAYFWEERNKWFSDVWEDVKGTSQKMQNKELRNRNGAYPFELAYRLINMYSVKGDTVLDPFLGTGTTIIAAIASGRNSVGYEIDPNFKEFIIEGILDSKDNSNEYILERINNHINFVNERVVEKGPLKHESDVYDFAVMTSQERKSSFQYINEIYDDDGIIVANYNPIYKNDVGATITIDQKDDGQNVTTKKKTKQMTL
ncbi:site-specific DNA-methyltransferase [uncultured Methanobrevibacter sp.]|uniref:DNA-methyltransferase n=1 Tax=uncultured Methanobrevibacter sp. TaxID=253161 RepID=UPI0025E701F0|nr:site-specific DNA-methyltransferase [uncultured Methanobrevibacter sp.]